MGTSTKIIIAVVAVAVIAGGALLLGAKPDKTTTQTSNQKSEVTITYTEDGFSLSASSVKSGAAVTFVNDSEEEIEPMSNPHPVHTDNPELNVGDLESSESKTVILKAKGTWGFHNHYDHDKGGTITVE
jgi:hypothetical protein